MQAKLIVAVGALLLGTGSAVAIYQYAFASNSRAETQTPQGAGASDLGKSDRTAEIKGEAPKPDAPKVRKKPAKKKDFGTLEEEGRSNSADRLLLPNGKSVPVLNGAYGAPKMDWPEQIPYSPIINVEIDGRGMKWYVHEDGSRSITMMTSNTVTGKTFPITQVANPQDAQPQDPTALPKPAPKKRRKGKKNSKSGKNR